MNVCIIGWYGTETLGDRAILDGILAIFDSIASENNYYIGSLFPPLTDRTIFEDSDMYSSHGKDSNVHCFTVRKKEKLQEVILHSDIIIMGGGPLMEIAEMHIIEYAFQFAQKHGKPTAFVGCGFNKIQRIDYVKSLQNILNHSNKVIMRSEGSKLPLFFRQFFNRLY